MICSSRWWALAAAALLASTSCSRPVDQSDTQSPPPLRVIALAPSAVETICALGWCDRLVGVGSYVSHPPETDGLPRLGGLVDADLEKILLLEPDLVVVLESEDELAAKLTALDVGTLAVPSDSLADVGRAAELIATRFGDPERGRGWRSGLESRLAPQLVEDTARILLVMGRPPGAPVTLLIPGEDTYLGDLVERAGAEPAIDGFGAAYRNVDLATALTARPDVILEFGFEAEARAEEMRTDWRQVYPQGTDFPCHRVITGGHVVVPGPRVDELYADIVEALEHCRSGNPASTLPGGDKPLPYARR